MGFGLYKHSGYHHTHSNKYTIYFIYIFSYIVDDNQLLNYFINSCNLDLIVECFLHNYKLEVVVQLYWSSLQVAKGQGSNKLE